jgi:hypothetical protein
MEILGWILIGLGIAVIGGGGIPPYGFSRSPVLLDKYCKNKAEGREPTLDEKDAYAVHIAHKVGFYLVILGGLILFFGFLISERYKTVVSRPQSIFFEATTSLTPGGTLVFTESC